MAPKRGRRVVKTTKVVEETTRTLQVVSTIGSQSQSQSQEEQEAQDQAQAHEQAQPDETKRSESRSSVFTMAKSIPIIVEDEFYDTEATQEPDDEQPPRSEEAQTRQEAQVEANKKESPAHNNKKKRRKRGGGEGYKVYVYRVMKQVHPGMGITGRAMSVINNFMEDMFERLAREAYYLSLHSKKPTMSVREIQTAVKLVLPGELAKHAVAQGTKALTNYFSF